MRARIFVFLSIASVAFSAPLPHGELEQAVLSPPRSRLGLDLFSWVYLSPLSHWNGHSADVTGAGGTPIQIVNQLTLHTPAFGPFDFEVTPQFVFGPSHGERVGMLDPSVGVEATLWESGGFTYWARYETLVPLTAASRDEGLQWGPQAVQGFEYAIPETRLRAEISTTLGVKFFAGGESKASLYFSPRLYYSLTDAFSVFSMVEASFESERQEPLLDLKKSGDLSVGMGVKYVSNAGEGMWVQPFLNFFPAGPFASNAHLALFFGGPLL